MSIYQTHPLDPCSKSIRLLEFAPTTPLSCSLTVASLLGVADIPGYKTISYVWGHTSADISLPSKETCQILCDGRSLPIPRNLYQILSLVVAQSRKPLLIWADSICINQEDVVERNSQVSLMADIYRHCDEVVIWLGETFSFATRDLSHSYHWHGDQRDQKFIDAFGRILDPSVDLVTDEEFVCVTEPDHDAFGALCLLSRVCQGESPSDIAYYKPRLIEDSLIQWSRRVRRALWKLASRAWVSQF
jgi:hypothetical protein